MDASPLDIPDRRRALLAAAGLGLLATATAPPARAQSSATARRELTPQLTEGPFYIDPGLVRSDIAEGKRGVPLELRIGIVDVDGRPLSGCRVDLWHCDAAGFYSGFAGQGERHETSTVGRTFLRGTVLADANGLVVFRTIYPGWYEGRTAHLHYKVFNGNRVVLTSQLFLPDALSEFLYTNVTPYRRFDPRDTLNRDDGIAHAAGDAAFVTLSEQTGRYVASATAVVDPAARPVAERPPGNGPPGARPRRDDAQGMRGGISGGSGGMRGGIGMGNGPGGARGGGPMGHGDRRPDDDAASNRGERPPSAAIEARRDHPVLTGEARVAALVPG